MSNEEKSVGYKRPPRHTQFKPGTSGNPGGRPKKRASLLDDMQEELDSTTTIEADGLRYNVTRQRALANKILEAAINGDMRAAATVISLAQAAPPEESSDYAEEEAALSALVDLEIQRRKGES